MVAVVWLFVRGTKWVDDVSWWRGSDGHWVRYAAGFGKKAASAGRMTYTRFAGVSPGVTHGAHRASGFPPGSSYSERGTLGFAFWTLKTNRKDADVGVSVPYWSLLILFGVLPARWLWLQRRQALRRRRGRCLVCGYDLRASAGCCPECGTEAERTQAGAGAAM